MDSFSELTNVTRRCSIAMGKAHFVVVKQNLEVNMIADWIIDGGPYGGG